MEPNPYRRRARISWLVALLCGLSSVALWQYHEAGHRLFLVIFLAAMGLFGVLLAAIVAAAMRSSARRFDALAGGDEALVRWTTDEEHWKRFRSLDRLQRLRRLRRNALLMAVGPVLLLTVAAFVAAGPERSFDLAASLAIVGAAFAVFVGWSHRAEVRHATRNEPPATAFIGRDGMVFRGRLVVWSGYGLSLTAAQYDRERRILRIAFEVRTRNGPVEHEVRVPVPAGRDAEADELTRTLTA